MSKVIKTIVHLLAGVSIYIIMVVGLGWFWTISESDNFERINSVLINLSYSFLTGYLVYLFTIEFPTKRRSSRINQIVADKLKSIVNQRIIPCLNIFVPIEEYYNPHSDKDLIGLFERGDLFKKSIYMITTDNIPIIDAFCKSGDLFVQDIDNIIKDYGQDLFEDTLKWLEDLKTDDGFWNCRAYRGRITYSQITNDKEGVNFIKENRRIAEGLLKLRDNILTYSDKYYSTLKKK